MRYGHGVVLQPIVGHKQPARQSLLGGVAGIGIGGLTDLHEAKKYRAKRVAAVHRHLQLARPNSECFTRSLNHAIVADTEEGRFEVGMVGSEGLVGTAVVLGVDRTPTPAPFREGYMGDLMFRSEQVLT